jgi:hypothetical protein
VGTEPTKVAPFFPVLATHERVGVLQRPVPGTSMKNNKKYNIRYRYENQKGGHTVNTKAEKIVCRVNAIRV